MGIVLILFYFHISDTDIFLINLVGVADISATEKRCNVLTALTVELIFIVYYVCTAERKSVIGIKTL